MLVFAGKQNGRSHRETHEARTSTKKKKKKHNRHVSPDPGIEPEP